MLRALLLGWLMTAGLGLQAQAVFRFTSEVSASASDGTSATSKVTLTLAPGTVWHAVIAPTDVRIDGPIRKGAPQGVDRTMGTFTPQRLYALRGGLYGLTEGEAMCFGVLMHHGSARAGNRSLAGPGSIQQNSSGSAWTLQEDAARFMRTKEGGVITCSPEVYLDEEPPEFGLLSPGAYDFGDAGDDAYRELMTFRLTHEDLRNLQRLHKVQEGTFTSKDGYCTQRYKLTLEGVPPEDETEVRVDVEEAAYRAWEPEGQLAAPTEPGNSLLVKVRVHKKGDPSTARHAHLKISIPYVSKNPGVCMNWPAEGASSKEGLRFRTEEFEADGPLRFKDITHLESNEELHTVSFRVHAYDYGAWGTLRVVAKDGSGRDLAVLTRGKDTPDLSIPLDDDGNRVADGWEARMGAKGKAATEDEDDQPAGKPGTKGDGVSLYEEYRGFAAKGAHVRTDPRKKDLFVCDETKLAEPGIALFEKASGIVVHRVTLGELGNANRIINRHAPADTHVVDQHGVRIVTGPKGTSPIAAPAAEDAPIGPPVTTLEVRLPPGRDYAGGDGLADVAHELCHAVGIDHHADGGIVGVLWSWEAQPDGSWQLMEKGIGEGKDGSPFPLPGNKPIQVLFEATGQPLRHGDALPSHFVWNASFKGWMLLMGLKDSLFGGDQECLIRYPDKQAYTDLRDPHGTRWIPDESRWKMRTRLCDGRVGTGVNAPDHRPQSRYGGGTRGDCKGQLVVSDRYAGR